MKNIIHVPLESYRSRYTEYLSTIEQAVFGQTFSKVTTVLPAGKAKQAPIAIKKGRVLDSFNRPAHALGQSLELLKLTQVDRLAPIYFSDFYHPGLDALAYAGAKNPMYSFLWAQTFDQYDFTATTMMEWMRAWEHMALSVYSRVFVASELLRDLIETAIPSISGKVIVAGLPFNSTHVHSLLKGADTTTEIFDCAYSSRWDTEKNPNFFLDLVESMPERSFVICTASEELSGTDNAAVQRAVAIASNPHSNLIIRKGLTRSQYYAILEASKCQFNCASQDWVSYTLLEALTFGCHPVYPMTRSFPEALKYNADCLYAPLNLTEARSKLEAAIEAEFPQLLARTILAEHDESLHYIAHVIADASF